MSGRHQPEAGADSPAALRSFTPPPEYRAFRVQVQEEFGSRFWITLNAMGAADARHKAEAEARSRGYFDVTALKAEEAA